MGDPSKVTTAVDGNTVAFVSLVGFAGLAGSALAPDYLAVRDRVAGTNGWSTHGILPANQESVPFSYFTSQTPSYRLFSPDLATGVLRALTPLTDAPNVMLARNLYRRTDLRNPAGGAYDLLTASMDPVLPDLSGQYQAQPADASSDLSHVIFESKIPLTAEAPECAAASYNDCPAKLYEWVAGSVRLAGILPDGSAAPSSAAGRGAVNRRYTTDTMSDDGSRIFFTSPANQSGTGDLYARVDGATSVRLNTSERSLPDAPQPATFAAATPDGAFAFFVTTEQLTEDDDNAQPDLYRYAFDVPAGATHLSRLSAGDGDTADTLGVIGVSDDGQSVYFVASGQMIAGAPSAPTTRIYLWRNGVLRDVGGLRDDATIDTGAFPYTLVLKPSRVSPDGRFLLFSSNVGDGLTGYDHGSACGGGTPCAQLYVYDADGNGGAGKLACASCNLAAPIATSDASSEFQISVSATDSRTYLNRALSYDGQVFFSTGESLVAEDVNGTVDDVYEYDIPSGTLTLISSGRDQSGSYFMDATPSGDDLFFITRDQLSGWDVDDAYDLYDARVGGGMPEPVPPLAPCTGRACQGSTSEPPSTSAPGSIGFDGTGDVRKRGSAATFHLFAPHRAKGTPGAVRVRVRVSDAGTVRVRMRGSLRGQPRTLASKTFRAQRGGTVSMRLVLSPAARTRLRHVGRLRITVVASYSRARGTQRTAITLRREAVR